MTHDAFLVLLTVYTAHLTHTAVAQVASREACRSVVPQLDDQIGPVIDSAYDRAFVVARCVKPKGPARSSLAGNDCDSSHGVPNSTNQRLASHL
jgi:hypothetical protein